MALEAFHNIMALNDEKRLFVALAQMATANVCTFSLLLIYCHSHALSNGRARDLEP